MCLPLFATILPNATSAVTLTVALALIAAAAFAGGSSVALASLGHRPMQVLLSFTGGVLLGVGMLHLLPHAWMQLGRDLDTTMAWALGGFFLRFLLERAFHAHAHHTPDDGCCDHDHDDDPEHSHDHHRPVHRQGGNRWAWCGAFAGLALHSLADGAALAASVNADAAHGGELFSGLATFLAILLHKPFDAAIIATLMASAGTAPRLRTVVNVAYALVVPLGAVCFLASLHLFGGHQTEVLGIAMAMAAGAFLCIAAADLLPEVQFHSHDRVLLTASLALGLTLAWGISLVERSSHSHAAHAAGRAPDAH